MHILRLMKKDHCKNMIIAQKLFCFECSNISLIFQKLLTLLGIHKNIKVYKIQLYTYYKQ